MTSSKQNNTMKDGFLIVEIKEDRKIILQKTFDKYNGMRESSTYSISEFNKKTILCLYNMIHIH